MLPLRDLPPLLANATSVGVVGALLLTVAGLGAALYSSLSVEVVATADERGVHVERGKRKKEYGYGEFGGLLRHQDRVWLIRRNGNLLELKFESGADAERFEDTVRKGIGERRIELQPHPTAMTAPLTLVAMIGSCAVTMAAVPAEEPRFYIAILVVVTAVLVAGRFAGAMRGKKLVLGRDGIRLGSKLVSFDAIERVEVVKERVTITDKEGRITGARVRMPKELAEALDAEFSLRIKSDEASGGTLTRETGEALHPWLQRIAKSIQETSFRAPGMQKERVRVAALHPKSPLRVRVAALAGLMDEDPGLAQELLEVSADPRLEQVAKAAQGSEEDWRRAVERLEREGALE